MDKHRFRAGLGFAPRTSHTIAENLKHHLFHTIHFLTIYEAQHFGSYKMGDCAITDTSLKLVMVCQV